MAVLTAQVTSFERQTDAGCVCNRMSRSPVEQLASNLSNSGPGESCLGCGTLHAQMGHQLLALLCSGKLLTCTRHSLSRQHFGATLLCSTHHPELHC